MSRTYRNLPGRPGSTLGRTASCLCDWQCYYCSIIPRPANCRGPHVSEKPPTWFDHLRSRWARWVSERRSEWTR